MSEKDMDSSKKGSSLARQSTANRSGNDTDNNINDAVEEGSLKDYYNALSEADRQDDSLSSLPDYIIDTLINADDDAFAEFLSARTLSKDTNTKHGQEKSTSDSNKRRDTNKNIEPTTAKETDDNSINNNDSSNPPPLVLPPVGAVKYDESFIEMVIRIVNRRRDKNNINDDDEATDTQSKGKGKEHAKDVSTPFADEDEDKEKSIPTIERARREKPGTVEDSLLLEEYSFEEDELLFLADDKIPSFLYDDNVDPTSSCNGNATSRVEIKKEVSTTESTLSRKKKVPQESSFSIQFDDVLDQSCDSIEAIRLNDEAHNYEQLSIDDEDSTEFIKDYSSWLCFDNENNCMTFKENCGSSDCNEPKNSNKQTNAEANQQLAEKQGPSDSEEHPEIATPFCVLPEPNSKEAVSNDTSLIVFRSDNASNCAKTSEKAIQNVRKIAEKVERGDEEEVGLEGRNTSPLSSSNSLNIESFIIATSTPSRNDSQQTSNSKIRSEMFKTTPTKRRSKDDDDDYNHNSSPNTVRTYDYRSSPVRRRLLEAHASDKRRNTTPSPPLVFPKGRTESEGTD